MQEQFRRFSHCVSNIAGSPWAFSIAFLAIIVWAVSGPFFGFSTNWQLVVNTGTTILTFLMVFLIQNTQNRDSHAMHLKLDELIHSIDSARDQLIDIEDESDEMMNKFEKEYKGFSKDNGKI